MINLITRSGFDGVQGNFYYGEYDEGDGPIEKYDMLFGVSGDRGSLTLAVEYGTEGMIMATDRNFTAFPQGGRHPDIGWTAASQWGHLIRPSGLGGGTFVLDRGADWRSFSNFHPQNTGTPHGPDKDVTNTLSQTSLRSGQELRSFFVHGVYELTPSIFWRTDVLYGERTNNTSIAGYPYQSASFNTPMSAQSYYNPLGVWHGFENPTDVQFIRRTFDVARTTEATTKTWRFSTAIEGSFEAADRYFTWDIGGAYSNSDILRDGYGDVTLSSVRAAVGPSFLNDQGVVQCGTPSAPIPLTDCVPWNPFIPFGRVGDGGLTGNQALQDFLMQPNRQTGDTETTILTANLAGDIIQLPAGPLSFAVGVEHRKEEGIFVPDGRAIRCDFSGLCAGITEGEYSLDEFYAELLIPVLSDAPFARELSFNLASRYSDYDTFGDTTNSKAGFKWAVNDTLIVRGTWAEGFRAPTINNLFGGGSQTFAFFTDPCDTVFGASATNPAVRANCARDLANADSFRQLAQGFVPTTTASAQTPVAFTSGSNPLLEPETSRGKNLGFVWSPGGFLEGANFGIDWWKIKVENTMVTDSPNQILTDCYVDNIAARCRLFTRDASLGYVNNLSFGLRNAGYVEHEGVDVELAYCWETDYGSFSSSLLSTYMIGQEFKSTNDASASPSQQTSFGSNYRLRSNFSLGWEYGDFAVTWGARYYSKMKEACLNATAYPGECSDPGLGTVPVYYPAANVNVLGSNTFHDLQFRWKAPWDAVIAVGANNVTDHIGPPTYSQIDSNVVYNGGFDIGRFWYVKYQQNF